MPPPGVFGLTEAEDFGGLTCWGAEGWRGVAGRLALAGLWDNLGCCAEAASAEGAVRAAAESTALARPWRRRSTSGREWGDMKVLLNRDKVDGYSVPLGSCLEHGQAQRSLRLSQQRGGQQSASPPLSSSKAFQDLSERDCWSRCIPSRSLHRCARSDNQGDVSAQHIEDWLHGRCCRR